MSSNGGNNNTTKQPSPVDQMVRNLAADSYTADGQYNQLGFAQPQPQTDLYNLPQAMHNGYNNYMLPEQPIQQEQPMYSPNGHYVNQNYVLPQQNMYMNESRYDKHSNNDYNAYQNLNLNYQPYLNFAADNSYVYDTNPQQFNTPQAANSNQFLENLSGHWSTPNNTGTYSPFGNSTLFASDSNLTHKVVETPMNVEISSFNQFGSVREATNAIGVNVAGAQQQLPKKARAIAEVKPMRPSYSDVLLKSAPTAVNSIKFGHSNNKLNDVKDNKTKTKDGNSKKIIKTIDKLNKNSLNRSNTSNEIKDLPNADKGIAKKVNLKPVVHHQLNRKWASLDNVTNDQSHDFNKPDPILDHKPKSSTKSTTPKSIKKNPKSFDKLPNFNDTSNKQANIPIYQADSESSSSQSNYISNSTKHSSFNDNGNNSANRQGSNIGAKRGNSGVSIRVVRQRNYEQTEKERQGGWKRGGQRGGRGKRDCNMPLGLIGQYCRQYLSEWWKILMRFILWLYHLIFDICSMSTTITIDFLYSFRNWILQQYASLSSFVNNVDQNPLLYLWNKIRRKKPISDETTRTGTNPHVAGLHHNINMPTTGEEAMKRLLACKGKDPYSILGLTADCSDEDIRRYYRRQAFLVHPDKNQQPGAEEAFKILVHAFDMIGVPERRETYDRGVAESVQVEQAWSELTTLLAQLQAKVAAAANTIRCSTCSSRHKRTRLTPPRPVYAARWCAQCRIRHGAREGDIWAESVAARVADNGHTVGSAGSGVTGDASSGGGVGVLGKWWVYVSGGWRWRYYACMEGAVYDVTEWAACQKESLKHLKADQHCVQYRIALGKQQQQSNNTSSSNHNNSGPSGPNTSSNTSSSKRNRNNGTNYANQSGAAPDLEHLLNSLYGQTDGSSKAGTASSNGNATGQDGGSSSGAQNPAGRKRSRKNK